MTTRLRRLSQAAIAAVIASGVVYGTMAYAMVPADPMDVVNHPWQPTMLHAHVLAAALAMFTIGALWTAHVWPRLCDGDAQRRRSGLALLLLFPVMAVSGYLLQVVDEPATRAATVVVHDVASGLWVLGYAAHWWVGRRARGEAVRAAAAAIR